MVGSRPNWEESMGSQCQYHFLNLEQRRDREVSVHTTHTSRTIQLKIDRLRRRLRCERWRRTPSNSNFSFDNDRDGSYRLRSRTPSSESFSCDEDYHHKRKNKSPSRKGLGNNAISRALNQISKSPSHAELKEENFLGGLLNQHSSCTMVEQTL